MPYDIREDGSEEKPYCVYIRGTDRRLGCTTSHERAQAMIAAIEENKAGGEPKPLEYYIKMVREKNASAPPTEEEMDEEEDLFTELEKQLTPEDDEEEPVAVDDVNEDVDGGQGPDQPEGDQEKEIEEGGSGGGEATADTGGEIEILPTYVSWSYWEKLKDVPLAMQMERARHSVEQCMQCDAEPTKAYLWAEGMALAWFCDKHAAEWLLDNESDVVARTTLEKGVDPREWAKETINNHYNQKGNDIDSEASAGPEPPKRSGLMETFEEVWNDLGQRLGDFLLRASWSTAYINDLPDSAFLYIEDGGEKDDEGKTEPRSLRHLPYKDAEGNVDLPHLRNAISRLGQSATGTGEDGWLNDRLRSSLMDKAQKILKRETGEDKEEERKSFWTVKTTQGYRWFTVSSTAFRDRENEIVSRKALQKAVDRAPEGDLGPLRFWHLPGWDFGDCDFRMLDGLCLIESGLWRDDPVSKAVRRGIEQATDDYTISIGFWPSVKDVERDVSIGEERVQTVFNDIEIGERSFLPKEWASNTFTLLGTQGGPEMSKASTRHEVFRGLIGDDDLFEQFMAQVGDINAKASEDDAVFKAFDDEENPLQVFVKEIVEEHEKAAEELELALGIMQKEETEEKERTLVAASLTKARALLPDDLSDQLDEILKDIVGEPEEEAAPEEKDEEPQAEDAVPQTDSELLDVVKQLADQLEGLKSRIDEFASEEAPRMTKRRPDPEGVPVDKDDDSEDAESARVVNAIGDVIRGSFSVQ